MICSGGDTDVAASVAKATKQKIDPKEAEGICCL
jgi:hypothetical protein